MTRHLYLLAEEQNIATLLLYANNSVGKDQCQSHLFLRYNWHDSDLEREVDFSKSFECLIDVVTNCGYMNLANFFKNCHFDAEASCEVGFITFKTNDNATVFSFAYILDEGKNRYQNLLRISGSVDKSIDANDNNLLGYLLSLGI